MRGVARPWCGHSVEKRVGAGVWRRVRHGGVADRTGAAPALAAHGACHHRRCTARTSCCLRRQPRRRLRLRGWPLPWRRHWRCLLSLVARLSFPTCARRKWRLGGGPAARGNWRRRIALHARDCSHHRLVQRACGLRCRGPPPRGSDRLVCVAAWHRFGQRRHCDWGGRRGVAIVRASLWRLPAAGALKGDEEG